MKIKGKQTLSQIFKCTAIILLLCLTMLPFNFTKNCATTLIETNAEQSPAPLSINYLSSPELIEANPQTNTLFVYDNYTHRLLSFDPATKSIKNSSSWTGEVLSLCHTDNYLVALIKESDANNSLYIVDETTLERTKLTYDDRKQISCFTACKDDVYLYLSSEEVITTAVIEVNTAVTPITARLNREDAKTITKSEFGGDQVERLMLSNNTLYYTTTIDGVNTICKITDDGDGHISKDDIYTCPTEYGTFVYGTAHNETQNCILTSNNYLLKISGDNITPTAIPNVAVNSHLTSVTFINTTQYFADSNTQTIWELKNDTLTSLFQNQAPTPLIASAKHHQYIEITSTTGLYATPFSTISEITLNAGTRLIAIATDDDAYYGFYYCLYTTKTENIYGYLPKNEDTYKVLEKTSVYIPLKVIGDTANDVYYLPSTLTDSKNQNFKQLSNLSLTTQVMAQKVTNSAGDDFYLIELENDVYGYIRYSQVTSNFASIQTERIKCNGKTKRDTLLLLSPSSSTSTTYSESDIDTFNATVYLNANTRVLLNEKVKSSNKYTSVTYQTDSGETYIGYVLTADLDADGLTPLQSVGVALIGVNILILVIIFVARKKVITARENSIPTAE